jgi:hypothetical protein
MNNLPQPLKTWLTKSYLTEPINNSSILFVDQEYYKIINTTHYLSLIYPVVKSIHSEVLSLHISSLPFSDHIKNKLISFESITVEL